MNTSTAYRASNQRPCPVCGAGTKGCSANADGSHFCRGEPLAGWKCVKRGDQFNTYRPHEVQRPAPPSILPFPAPAPINWAVAAERFAKRLTDERRGELADLLGLPVSCLAALPLLGYLEDDREGPCFTFPEHGADGRVTAINRRYVRALADGNNKKVMRGGKRGLYLPDGWRDRPGPVLVPEGVSDVLALSACGLSAVGRPNNSGGADLLARLLNDVDKEIVVFGENDRKPSGEWPGGEGKKVAEKTAVLLNRPVAFRLPPPDAKDARVWVQQLAPQTGTPPDYELVGREILARLRDQADEPPTVPVSRFKFTDSAEFRKADYRVEWFVEYVLARGHPAVLAGPSKGMKTSVAVDLAVSVATGTTFLGKWSVNRRAKVAIVSGESGGAALQEMFRRVLREKGLTDDACDGWLKWEFCLPTFADLIDTADFADRLGALGCELVVIDPFYLTLGEIDPKNMFAMGPALRAVAELLLVKHKVTPVIAHHANRLLPVGEPMQLTHLAYAGLEQFLGQYVFLNRRTAYENDGRHELWLSYGGRAGHSGLWVLGIEEGLLGEGMPERKWAVTVTSKSESRDVEDVETRRATKQKKLTQNQGDEREVLRVIDAEAAKGLPGASVTWIDSQVEFSRDRVKAALERLAEAGAMIKVREFKKPSGNGALATVKDGYGRPSEG